MHRIDGNGHVGNMFDEGDPLVPRLPTQITADWYNDLQENVCNTIETAGIPLVKGDNTQLAQATVNTGNYDQTIGGHKTFTGGATVTNDHETDPGVSITSTGAGAGAVITGNGAGVVAVCPSGTDGNAVMATADEGDAGRFTSDTGYGIVLTTTATGSEKRAPLRLVPRTQPSHALAGDVFFSSVDSTLKVYDGSVWRTVTWS